jgi:MFS family permease
MALTLGMAALWFVVNYYQGALTAILPDRIPLEHRGVASSMIALGVPIGVIVGVQLGALVERPLALASLGLLLVLTTAALLFLAPEPPAHAPVAVADTPQPPLLVRFIGFFDGFRSFDFTIAMIARMLIFFSIFSVTAYTYYILQDYVGTKNLPSGDIKFSVSLMITIQMVACLVSTAISGWLVDRWQKPKLFVGISSIGIAVAFAIPMFSPSWPAMLFMQTSVGFFFGAYMAIDLALMSLVLPDPDNEGRDMALLSAAAGLPQILTPMFAAAVIANIGYYALFGAGALSALAAGVLIFLIRSVR